MSKASKLYKVFMTAMIVAIAGMLLASGIIAIQKSITIKTTITMLPSHNVEIYIKDIAEDTETLIFRNFELKDITGGVGGNYVNSNIITLTNVDTLTFNSNYIKTTYGNTFALVIVKYTAHNESESSDWVSEARVSVDSALKETIANAYPAEIKITPQYIDGVSGFDWAYPEFLFSDNSDGNIYNYATYTHQFEISVDNLLFAQDTSLKIEMNFPYSYNTYITSLYSLVEYSYDFDAITPTMVAYSSGVGGAFSTNYTGLAAPVLKGLQISYYDEGASTFVCNRSVEEYEWTMADNSRSCTISLNSLLVLTIENVGYYKESTTLKAVSDAAYYKPVSCGGLYFVPSSNSADYYFVDGDSYTQQVGAVIRYTFSIPPNETLASFEYTWLLPNDVTGTRYVYDSFCSELKEVFTPACVTPDTLITLADGSQKRVDELTGNEQLLVWNMRTGKFDSAPIMFIDSDAEAEFDVIKLMFDDDTEVKVIYEHGFWDYDLNKYVYILEYNAFEFIGHTFAKQNGDELKKVKLIDVEIETTLTTAWSPITAEHLGYFVNGMMSMPGGTNSFVNMFDFDTETITYDIELMEQDIETYGLFSYEELNAICPLPEELFYGANAQYLKVSIAKGLMTLEELIYKINMFRDAV